MMSSISRVVRAIRCWWPSGRGGAPGRVTSIRSATSLASSSAASSRSALCSISASSSLRALLAAPPTGPRSSGGSCAMPRRIWVSSALRPRYLTRSSSSSALEEAATIASVASTRIFSICSSIGPHLASRRRYPPPHGDAARRGGGDVERLGAAPQRDRRGRVAGGEDLGPAAPPARRRGRGSRRRRAPRAPRRRGRRARPAASGVASTPATRRRPGEDRAHAGPGRLRAEGVGAAGAERDGRVEQRVGGADDRADVAGIADPVR